MRNLWLIPLLLVTMTPTLRGQCFVGAPSTCTVVGPGHVTPPSLGSSVVLRWAPPIGTFCFTFSSPPSGVAILILSAGPCPPPLPIPGAPLCSAGFLYPALSVILTPGQRFCPALPASLMGSGVTVCLQGFDCLACCQATDGYQVTL